MLLFKLILLFIAFVNVTSRKLSLRTEKQRYDNAFDRVTSPYQFFKNIDLREHNYNIRKLKCLNDNKCVLKEVYPGTTWNLRTPEGKDDDDVRDYDFTDYSEEENSFKDMTRALRQVNTRKVSEDNMDVMKKYGLERDDASAPHKRAQRMAKRDDILVATKKVLKLDSKAKHRLADKLVKIAEAINETFPRTNKGSEEDESTSKESSEESKERTDVQKRKPKRFNIIDNKKKDKSVSESEEEPTTEKRKVKPKGEKSEGLSFETSVEKSNEMQLSAETTTIKYKKKKRKKGKTYFYMQGPSRMYLDSEEGFRTQTDVFSRRGHVDVTEVRSQRSNDLPDAQIKDPKTSVSEDYMNYEEYRRRLEQFMPKRYFWKKKDINDLGYFWFNGPQGVPGTWKIMY